MRDNVGTGTVVPVFLASGETGCASALGANILRAISRLDLVAFGRQAADTMTELVKHSSPLVVMHANGCEASISWLDNQPGVLIQTFRASVK